MARQAYPSDLSDTEWGIVAPLVLEPKMNGRRATSLRRELLDAMFYVTKTGCGWEWLSHDFPKWKTVYHYFRLWRVTVVRLAIHTALREVLRCSVGREAQPSGAIINSQSVKTTYVGGPDRGFDGAKRVNRRKRHIVVDTLGLLLIVMVHAANIGDRDAARQVVSDMPDRFPRLRKL
jgi:putative transposase